FQSPLRRGSVFILDYTTRYASTIAFQSPLRRGSVFIVFCVKTILQPLVFQSPLRRGSVFIVFCVKTILQPLVFQSPLRRGSVFIKGGGKAFNCENLVSIPSSSGKCLHPKLRLLAIHQSSSFNPL